MGVRNGISETEETYEKKCASKVFGCQYMCNVLSVINVHQCISFCCQGDGCNKSEERKVVIGKRSNVNRNVNNNNSNNIHQQQHTIALYFITISNDNIFNVSPEVYHHLNCSM